MWQLDEILWFHLFKFFKWIMRNDFVHFLCHIYKLLDQLLELLVVEFYNSLINFVLLSSFFSRQSNEYVAAIILVHYQTRAQSSFVQVRNQFLKCWTNLITKNSTEDRMKKLWIYSDIKDECFVFCRQLIFECATDQFSV